MKNLELLELLHKPLDSFLSKDTLFAQDSNTTYFISDNILHKHDFLTGRITELCPHSFDNVNLLKVLTIENKICVVSEYSIHVLDPEGDKEVQTLDFEADIAAVSWNPTEEIVAIVHDNCDVATYSIDYENGEIFPQGRSTVAAKIPDTVYVGWGSEDTQFRGSEGKLKKQPVETKPVEDRNPTISWRGNGEMFVVNYWEDSKRKFVVFETPCRALYRSEECPGLQPPVAWRPAGNMIATISETNSRQSVVIFEKNGQKRFDFWLSFDVRVKTIKWSPCAQILTLHTDDPVTQTQTIYLLTCSNYKWYIKQTLEFRSDNPLMDFQWLESTHFTYALRVVTRSQIIKYTFRHVVNHCGGICCVIDGNTVNLTDFNDSVIPPIMSLKKITNSCNVNFVGFFNSEIIICDCGNNLKIFDFDGNKTVSVCLSGVPPSAAPFPLAYHHLVPKANNLYLVAETAAESSVIIETNSSLCMHCMQDLTDPVKFLTACESNQVVSGIKNICPYRNIFVDDGCQNTVHQTVITIDDTVYSCRLLSNCHFYVNDDKINDCVNSFVVFDKYLLYTTKMNKLHCVKFDSKSRNCPHVRSVEQGATIVTPIPNSPKIVLQLPRGNLETISCRSISIDILDRLLNQDKWEEALTFVRLEKLNANLFFDLNPERFLGQVDRFVRGAKTISELNGACLEFEGGNVLDTIYGKGKVDSHSGEVDTRTGKVDHRAGKVETYSERLGTYPGKVDAVFGAILRYFDSCDYAGYITTIMIISLNFFNLRRALMYLQDLLRRSSDDVTLKQKLTDAVNTLKTYGCDQDELYAESLLLYDLELSHFVASCCQLDPRIYEPHISSLKNLSEIERRYQINVFAKRPKSAVAYLLRCPKIDSDTVASFIDSHNLGQVAYESCPTTNRHYPIVARAFAHDVSRRGDHQGAGVVLKRAGLSEEALEEFKSSLNWREVVNLLEELEVGEVERVKVISEVAERLCQNHVVKDAAILYEFYAGNYEMAVKVLLENCYFEEAIHVAKKHKRADIIVSEVVPLLLKHKTYLEEKLTDLNGLYDRHRSRLSQVRRTKVEKVGNVGYEDDDRGDLFSDGGSTITKTSRSSRSRSSSTLSSRNRRKEAKKKQNLREGGVYEDIALIRALHCTIKEFHSKGDEVRTCCSLLLQESDMKYKEVKALYDLYRKIDANIRSGMNEIWPPHFFANNMTQDLQELADLENFEHLDVEYRTPPSGHANWKLNFF